MKKKVEDVAVCDRDEAERIETRWTGVGALQISIITILLPL